MEGELMKKDCSLSKIFWLSGLFLDAFIDCILGISVFMAAMGIYMGLNERISGEPAFFMGYKPVYITSGSMEDTIRKGQIVIVEEMDGLDARIGDILLFKRDDSYVVHRYVAKDEEGLQNGERANMITKGDNNPSEDLERLDPKDVRAKVVLIP